jgi:hypothetical protein
VSHWSTSVNEQLGSTGIADISYYVEPLAKKTPSPIDVYYESLQALLSAGNAATLSSNPILGSLIVIGIVSATEDYFRAVFSRILKICPSARKRASDQSINFGSVLWLSQGEVERGALERTPLSDPDAIKRIARSFVAFDIPGPLAVHLNYFEQICELRHCIVHSAGHIQGKNAISLELPQATDRLRVKVGYSGVQEIASICAGMVRSFNTELFKAMAHRWAIDWRKSPSWDKNNEDHLFQQIWTIFASKSDRSRSAVTPRYGMSICKKRIKQEYGLT